MSQSLVGRHDAPLGHFFGRAAQDLEPALRRCTVPTRIVWGTGDTIFSPSSPAYLDRVFGNSRGLRRIAGSRLFWPEELPDVIADEARRLWGIEAVPLPR